MGVNEDQQRLLRTLPGVDHLLELTQADPFFKIIPNSVITRSIRLVIAQLRKNILNGSQKITKKNLSDNTIMKKVRAKADHLTRPNLITTINATGVVIHTNLGRSPLSDDAVENLLTLSKKYSNLEFDLTKGLRGSRYSCIEEVLCEISGAEAAMAVNNNAGAVLLCLETIAKGKKVIVSRGELIEIGGSFRIPDIMAKSGGILKEVGTTNRTHITDYKNAIDDNTGLLLKVHTSNYRVVGFSASVTLKELVALGMTHHVPVMEDLGSGTFIDFSRYGMIKEPTIQESVATGVDVVTFSGDKLLGGPQAGIILGKADVLQPLKKNPLTRALRIDKLTLAALESTLSAYRDETRAIETIPTLKMLTMSLEAIEIKAAALCHLLEDLKDPRLSIQLIGLSSRAGGGALPLLELPTKCIAVKIKDISANAIEKFMRKNSTPIIGRIEEDRFIIDPRTIQDDEIVIIATAFKNLLKRTF
ncbi:MAG: L-seryl-tRNA(Sec) selenium transferase [Desulfobacterales bacterium]